MNNLSGHIEGRRIEEISERILRARPRAFCASTRLLRSAKPKPSSSKQHNETLAHETFDGTRFRPSCIVLISFVRVSHYTVATQVQSR